jgi:Peptidase_C39 like family/Tetratricopeptide repeat
MAERTGKQVQREYLRRQYEIYAENPAEFHELESERRSATRTLYLKFALGMIGLGMMLFAGLTLFSLILVPSWYRSLPGSEQIVWSNRIPILAVFRPTRVYNADVLPTRERNDEAARALLANASATPTRQGDSGLVSTPTSASMAPTLLLVTNTPVIAALGSTPTLPPTQIAAVATVQPTATPTMPPTPLPTSIPVPAYFQATGFRYEKQKWNTCGPANLTQVLHYFNWGGSQDDVINSIKPNREDRNVSPWELVDYVNEVVNKQQGVKLKALVRFGGNMNLLKQLVANGYGVMIEKGYNLPEEGWLGHYLTLQGYDDTRGEMHGLDTYLGDRWESYTTLDQRWQQFNRVFIVIYPEDRERALGLLLGEHRDPAASVQIALNQSREEASRQPDNPYTWFNVGSNYVMSGQYDKAVIAFDQALSLGVPWRMLWYQFTLYEAYYNSGQYNEVIKQAQATLNTSSELEESHYWMGMALAAMNRMDEAKSAMQRALNINRNFRPALLALSQIQNGVFRAPK